jgi:chorismate mutase
MRRIIPLSLLAMVVPGCRPAMAPPSISRTAPDQSVDRLLILMRSRLDVMHDVARWKWAKKSPIEDPEREAALLQDVAAKGIPMGLHPDMTRAFFAAQIEAAKIIQRADFGRWEADHQGPEGKAPDLAGVLRPRIDALNRELLAALTKAKSHLLDRNGPERLRERANVILVGEGVDATVRTAAIGPLLSGTR